MSALSSVSDIQLLERLLSAVRSERAASAEVIAHLAEVDQRRLYLEQALFLLSQRLTAQNAELLLGQARGKSRRELDPMSRSASRRRPLRRWSGAPVLSS